MTSGKGLGKRGTLSSRIRTTYPLGDRTWDAILWDSDHLSSGKHPLGKCYGGGLRYNQSICYGKIKISPNRSCKVNVNSELYMLTSFPTSSSGLSTNLSSASVYSFPFLLHGATSNYKRIYMKQPVCF